VPGKGLSRRALIGAGAAGGAAAAAGVVGFELGSSEESGSSAASVVPFHGLHQAGITTPAQDRLHFASFDVMPGVSRADLRDLLREWTTAATHMTAGRPAGTDNNEPLLPPADTGEAAGLSPSQLTVTFGFGPGLFHGRFGLARSRPLSLRALPGLPGDELDPARSGGDLCVQACANDPQVAFHAVRNLTRIGRGLVIMRWSQLGFGRTSTTSRSQATPRNLMGFKDGTNNIKGEDAGALRRHVWVGAEGPAWLRGGSYIVTRRIRMLIESWDRATLADQEQTIGRSKGVGAPLGRAHEFDPVDFRARGDDGQLRVPVDAHVRQVAPQMNGGIRILRRGYSFTDGFDAELGQLDAGLFFIAYQRDPHRQFVPLQQKAGANDALNEYIKHTSSAVFAVPPGVRGPRDWVGRQLFSA
jgi:deferrochelatase/peroxidase EfeB